MLICHELVASNGAEVLQACHMSDLHANIGSVYHASIVRGCVTVSISSSVIYHFWFLKHHHSAATPHHHRRCMWQLSYPWKLHACRANNYYFLHIVFTFLIYVFGIVFNCIIQNNSYCLHWQCFSIQLSTANALNNSSFTGGVFFTQARGKSMQKNR